MDPLIPPGRPVPQFRLPDLHGGWRSPDQAAGRILILNFWSAECPWSERVDGDLLRALPGWEGVSLWAIASNAHEPDELVAQVSQARGLPVTLLDAGGQAARRFGAQTTPHLFVCDRGGLVRYQGAFDDVTFRQRSPGRAYLLDAVEALLTGRAPEPAITPAYGCALVLDEE